MKQINIYEQAFITTDELAYVMRVAPITVTRWINKGLLKAVKVGTVVRIPQDSFREFINANTK